MNALDIVGAVLSAAWGIFTDSPVPGLAISFGEWFMALLVVDITVRVVRFVFGFGISGTGYRSSSGGKKNISEKRKGDEK